MAGYSGEIKRRVMDSKDPSGFGRNRMQAQNDKTLYTYYRLLILSPRYTQRVATVHINIMNNSNSNCRFIFFVIFESKGNIHRVTMVIIVTKQNLISYSFQTHFSLIFLLSACKLFEYNILLLP